VSVRSPQWNEAVEGNGCAGGRLQSLCVRLDEDVHRRCSRMRAPKPASADGGHIFVCRLWRHNRSDDCDALARNCGICGEIGQVRSLQTGRRQVPNRRLRRPSRILSQPWSFQVGDELGEPAESSMAHAHEFKGNSRAVTKRSHQCHGAKNPRIHLDHDLSSGSKLEPGSGFDVLDATTAQAHIAQPACERGTVQRKAFDLCQTAAGIARDAPTISASRELSRRCLLVHAFVMLSGADSRTNG